MSLHGRKPHQSPLNSMLGTAAYANLDALPVGVLSVKKWVQMTPLSTAPENPKEGWTYYDATLKKLRCYDGTAWQNCW